MNMQYILRSIFLIFVTLLFTLPAFSSNKSDSIEIERIINDYGKSEVIEFIRKKRYGAVTTTRDNEYYGRPRQDLVTTKTILNDLDVINMDTNMFEEGLNKHLLKKKNRERQLIGNYNRSRSSSTTSSNTGSSGEIKKKISRELQLSSGWSEYKQTQLLTRISNTASAISLRQSSGLSTDDLQAKMTALSELYDELSELEVKELNEKTEKWAEEFRRSIKSRHLK